MDILSSLLPVTLAGLALGAGLPILFALGIRLGVPAQDAPPWRLHTARLIFAVVALAVLVGLLWVTQGRIYSTFGWDVFGTATSGGAH